MRGRNKLTEIESNFWLTKGRGKGVEAQTRA